MASTHWILPAPGQEPLSSPSLRLFCIPPAGSGAHIYHPWAKTLPEGVQLCPVELPGRNTRLREPRPTAMGPLVSALADALSPLTSSGPFALYGHSLGAWIAYELAQELASRGSPPPLALFVAGVRAPQLAGSAHDPDGVEMHRSTSSEFWATMERRYGPNPELQDPAVRKFMEPQLRADFQMAETYRPAPGRPSLGCPLYVLGGDRDPRYKREQLEAWRAVAGDGGFEARMFRGGHMFLFKADESAREVSEYVNQRLRGLMAQGDGAAAVAEVMAEAAPASPVASPQAPGSVRSADSEAGATVGSGSSALALGLGPHGMERHGGEGGGSELEELGTPKASGRGGVFKCCW